VKKVSKERRVKGNNIKDPLAKNGLLKLTVIIREGKLGGNSPFGESCGAERRKGVVMKDVERLSTGV